MPENPYTYNQNEGCNRVASPVAPGENGCVQAGGASKPPLSPFMGGATDNSPIVVAPPPVAPPDRPETLACPNVTRILLSERASAALLAAGEAFAIVGRGSYPDAVGRMVLYLLPVPKRQADDACAVALGQARAVKPKPATSQRRATASPPPATP
jgi:hypothetical protein